MLAPIPDVQAPTVASKIPRKMSPGGGLVSPEVSIPLARTGHTGRSLWRLAMSDEEDEAPPVADPPSPSLGGSQASSVAPAPNGHQVGAQQLSNHPVWVSARGSGSPRLGGVPPPASRGKGGGRGRGRGSRAPSDAGDINPPRYERISLAELEAKQYADGDGADSRIDSDDDAVGDHFDGIRPVHPRRKKQKKGPREECSDDESSDDDIGADDRRNKLAGLMGAAAFGGTGGHYGAGASDAGSVPSENSSARRADAMKNAFPVRGVTCVGCALANRIGPVNRFVRDNISLMTEDTLWKMSALCYKREVAEPSEREGAVVPQWGWKEVRSHYELHATGNFVARHKMIRSLQCMRQQQEQRLVRCDNGEKELDRQGADLMLKIMAAESKERQLLEMQGSNKKNGRD